MNPANKAERDDREYSPDEQDTQDRIIEPIRCRAERHDQRNEQTLNRYQQLSAEQKAHLIEWLHQNLAALALPAQTKKQGLKDLKAGCCDSNLALLMLRQAIQGSSEGR